MGQLKRCPYCGMPITVRYPDFCTLPTFKPGRWSGRCSHCNCQLEASNNWEALTGITSLVVFGVVLSLVMPNYPDAPKMLAWICAIPAVGFLYFLNGLIRYLTFSLAKLS